MSNHPLNLALRFALELAALGAFGYWGWTENDGIWRWIAALGLTLIAAVLWGTFRVPGDQERMTESFQERGWASGGTPRTTGRRDVRVAVSGIVRLLLEAVFFGSAVLLLALADQPRAALIFGVIIVLHYIASYDRVLWLAGRE